jgi:hypothetical protein
MMTEIEWVDVKESLPVIPKGKHAVEVLIVEFDPTYEELCPGKGASVTTCMYGNIVNMNMFFGSEKKEDFMELYYGADVEWGPVQDQVLYWAYFPPVPKRAHK